MGDGRFKALPSSLLAFPFTEPLYDATTGPTPLSAWKFDRVAAESSDLLFGYVTGSTGLDNIRATELLEREELEEALGIRFGRRTLLATFHPATADREAPETQLGELLAALDTLEETHVVFTLPNADAGGRALFDPIRAWCAAAPEVRVVHASLGRVRYLSTLARVDGVVGNSSSGLIEAPSFHVGTVNIGTRQDGRIRADSVIDCAPRREAISRALETLFSDAFREKAAATVNPFGDGHAAERIVRVLAATDPATITAKHFHDIPVPDPVQVLP